MQKSFLRMMAVTVCLGLCAGGSVRAAEKMSASDAKALIEEVSLKNNLEGGDIRPWHIRLTYTVDKKVEGKPYSGTIEEWWASLTQSRTEYVVNGQRKRFDVTDKGTYESGDLKEVPISVGGILTDVLWPMPATTTLAQIDFDGGTEKIDGSEMRCVEWLRFSAAPNTKWRITPGSTHWCMASKDPYLRIQRDYLGDGVFLRNDLVLFQGRAIAREYIEMGGKRILRESHIQTLETLPSAMDAIFQVPPEATPGQMPTMMAGAMHGPLLVYRVQPRYPAAANSLRMSGQVVLEGVIDAQGAIANLHPVSGPAAFIPASMEAVQQWAYIPLVVNNTPVPERVRIIVNYAFRR